MTVPSSPRIVLEISEATAYAGTPKPLQVAIYKMDENERGHGHRIAGPKYGGSGSRLLKRIEIDKATARAMIGYLQEVGSDA